MRNFVTGLSIFTTTLIILLTMGILTCSAKMTSFLISRERSLAVSRGTMGISEAELSITKAVHEVAQNGSQESFNEVTQSFYDRDIPISEEDAYKIYKSGFYDKVHKSVGNSSDEIITFLSSNIPDVKTGHIAIDVSNPPYFSMDKENVYIKNINLQYNYKDDYKKKESFEVKVPIRQIVLYDGNDEIFEYSLIAGKGIYITGRTSTIFGNVYGGVHEPSQMRDAEALYGEKNYYGGINIMSTQVAMHSDKIISEGAINLKGSFTLFGNEDQPTILKAKEIYETDNVANRNVYALIGEYESLAEESAEKKPVMQAMKEFENIEYYYDSENDWAYTGKYRKIISSTDITLYDDVTGIVITPGNVIVEENVNVEGLIICGDRIYIQGNNNIVSSPEVLRGIVKEEIYQDCYVDEPASQRDNMTNIHLKLTDYLGGIEYRGVK